MTLKPNKPGRMIPEKEVEPKRVRYLRRLTDEKKQLDVLDEYFKRSKELGLDDYQPI